MIHSYHPVKNITTGEGGAVLSNNSEFCEKVRRLSSHGMVRKFKNNLLNKDPWLYEMRELGYNYRITDIQCALGISQLTKLKKFIKRRNEFARIYNNHFKEIDICQTPQIQKKSQHAFHLYPLLIDFKKSRASKKILFEKMKNNNVNLQVHYIPIHLQPYYRKNYGFKKGDFPVAEKFYEKEITLPIHFSLKEHQISKIIKLIKKLIL